MVGRRLIAAAREALAYARGDLALRSYTIREPEAVRRALAA